MTDKMHNLEYTDVAAEKKQEFFPLWDRYADEWALLTDQELGELVRAMQNYARDKDQNAPVFEGAGRYFWVRVKADMDYAAAAYEKKVTAGKRGGRPKKEVKAEDEALAQEAECTAPETVCLTAEEKAKETKENQEKAKETKENQEKAKETKENQEKVKQIHNQNHTQNQIHNHNQQQNQIHNQNQQQNQTHNQNQPQHHPGKQGNVVVEPEEKEACSLGKAVVDCFFEERQDLERPPAVSKKLLAKAESLAKTYSMDVIRSVFRKTGQGFLGGNNSSGWTATLPWIVEKEQFQKVMDGHYDRRQGSASTSAGACNAMEYAQHMTQRVQMGTAGLGVYELESIRRMLAEEKRQNAPG